jgi:4-amino-4-deoxy-L-arabinose transferase-like glycosyltransferase
MRARPSPRGALFVLLVLAAAQYGWNALAQPGFWGYDEGGHAAYALAILETGALPHPLSGWSSFHPPVYHLLAAVGWHVAEPLGPRAVLFALRWLSALGIFAAAGVVAVLARRASGSESIAFAAAAGCLFVPVAQLAGTMVGNEALAAGWSALALGSIVALQRDPGDSRSAALAGLFAGLAFATKYSGAWTLVACAVPFLRRDLDRRGLRSLALCSGLVLLVAGPVYVRNLTVVGTPFPFTRTLEPMKSGEERLLVRPRRVADYLSLPWDCGRYPYVTVVAEGGAWMGVNPAMQSVPCLGYAGLWWDPFGIRATRTDPGEGLLWGRVLLNLGLAPMALVLLGFARAAASTLRSRGRAVEAPLVAVALAGAASFTCFTWIAPSLAAAKSSYLLPLLAPAGVFFALGCAALPRLMRRVAVALSLLAALVSAYAFCTGTVFEAADPAIARSYWTRIGQQLPHSHVTEAASRLLDQRE